MSLFLASAAKRLGAQVWRAALKTVHIATPHSLVDASLVSAGVVAAVGSVTFATYMLVQDAHAPMVYGKQYLALFAQPSRSARPALAQSAPAPPQFGALDMTPTGSIDAGEHAAEAGGWRVVGGRSDVVFLSDGAILQAVRAGDLVEGLGQVGSIAWRDGSWQLLDAKGRLLLAQQSAEAPAEEAVGRFSRRMIFGR